MKCIAVALLSFAFGAIAALYGLTLVIESINH